jgi:hypothetical protein
MPHPEFGGQSAAPTSLDQLHDRAMNFVETVCGALCMPVEIILRPRYGTRYFPVAVVFFSAMLMLLLPLLSGLATSVTHTFPFAGASPPPALFGLGSLSKLYFLLSFLHGFRLYRRMIHMETEEHSEFEGPALPFFRLIPGSGSFWFTRIVLEPACVFIAATLLERMLIVESGLATYLQVAAVALVIKNFIGWHRAWQYLRKLMDMRFAGPIVAKLVQGHATQEELAAIHLASFPKNVAPEMRKAAASHIARLFSPGEQIPAASTPVPSSGPNPTNGETHEYHS